MAIDYKGEIDVLRAEKSLKGYLVEGIGSTK